MTRFEAVRVLFPDSPLPPEWGWPRKALLACAVALTIALLTAAAVVMFEKPAAGASPDPVTSAERFLRHVGHRQYQDACTMAVDFDHPDRPLERPSPDYTTCMGNLIWLGSAHWSRTDLRNARGAMVRRVRNDGDGFVTVGVEDVHPKLPPIGGANGKGPVAHDILLGLQRTGGRWYVIWPPP
ncbi:hypothetical protein [Actinomadura rugatobispora]|uniref:Uncharacterized protein n=1 Tax=Actinomadura rugatobispora TaxID=1994 RepID=A0ABW0ZMW9_9ACTN|nr:hypothetical protein GCM10010200_024700 [Actinomadura rugatobispora]